MKWWEDSVRKHEEALQGQPIQDPSKGVANTGQCTAHGSIVKESGLLHKHCTHRAQMLLPHR